jgi:hypothetical protein
MPALSLASVDDAQLITFTHRPSAKSELFVYEEGVGKLLHIRRVFVIRTTAIENRGNHAHRACAQLLVALNGVCIVGVDDGKKRREVRLETPAEGLLIPPSIWADQRFEEGAVVMVMCDAPYDESDYIRDYAEYEKYRGVSR